MIILTEAKPNKFLCGHKFQIIHKKYNIVTGSGIEKTTAVSNIMNFDPGIEKINLYLYETNMTSGFHT